MGAAEGARRPNKSDNKTSPTPNDIASRTTSADGNQAQSDFTKTSRRGQIRSSSSIYSLSSHWYMDQSTVESMLARLHMKLGPKTRSPFFILKRRADDRKIHVNRSTTYRIRQPLESTSERKECQSIEFSTRTDDTKREGCVRVQIGAKDIIDV
jgi:hypothetical protein